MQCEVRVVDPLLQDSQKDIVTRLLGSHDNDAVLPDSCSASCDGGACDGGADTEGTIRASGRISLDIAAAGGLPPASPLAARRGHAAAPLLREARAILLHERKSFPLPTLVTILSLFVWLIFTDVMKDFAPCGGALYWSLVLSIVPVVAVILCIVRRVLIHNIVVKQQVPLPPDAEDAPAHAPRHASTIVTGRPVLHNPIHRR